MPSFSDWLGANAGQEAQTLQNALAKQQGDPNAIQNAYQAGKSGQQAPQSNASYGDFLKALQGNYQGSNAQTAAQAGLPSAFEGSLAQGAAGDQLKQAQSQYDQQQAAQQSAYTSGQKNADTAGAKAQQDAFQQSNFNVGQGHLTPEQAKQAQQDSLKAGAQYRLAALKQQFSKDPMHKFQMFGESVENVFDPGGLRKQYFDPLNIPGAVAQSDKNANWDPTNPANKWTGQDLTNNDQNFTRWLEERGYDPATGNGNGY